MWLFFRSSPSPIVVSDPAQQQMEQFESTVDDEFEEQIDSPRFNTNTDTSSNWNPFSTLAESCSVRLPPPCNCAQEDRVYNALSNAVDSVQGTVYPESLEKAAALRRIAGEILERKIENSKKSAGDWYEVYVGNIKVEEEEPPHDDVKGGSLKRYESVRSFRMSASFRSPSSTKCKGLFASIPPVKPIMGEVSLKDNELLSSKCGVDVDLPLIEMKCNNILVEVGHVLLQPFVEEGVLKCDESRLLSFLSTMQANYKKNPYHNAIHGAQVAHLTFTFARRIKLFESSIWHHDSMPKVILAIAALGHDVGHPGFNNGYMVKCMEPLALIYNDNSVLENYHSSRVFQILAEAECDIFEHESNITAYQGLRKRVIELILSTDMADHFSWISSFRSRRLTREFSIAKNDEDAWEVAKMCIKMADLGHAILEWNQHQQWSNRVVQEFYFQGDLEKQKGLPLSPLCDRGKHNEMAKSQSGFLEFVVMPLLTEVVTVAPTVRLTLKLKMNKKKWEVIAEKLAEQALLKEKRK